MYQRFYGLRELPFELTPNPRYLFLTPRHREALSNLQYAVSSHKPLTVLLGEAGTGKTTLLRTVLESDDCRNIRAVCLNNPVLTRAEFVQTLASRFGLDPRSEASKSAFLDELERVLHERRAQGEIAVLVVDEAQSLTSELLEEIRLLANIETATEKLLLLILAGQPEFAARLNEPGLRQLKQRIALRCEIAPFELSETAAYIASRIGTAGGDCARLFTREAVRTIHEYSGGIPRTINVICDNALVSAFGLGRQQVDREVVMGVVGDFDLGHEHAAARPVVNSLPERETVLKEAARTESPARPLFEQVGRPRPFAFFGTGRG